MNATFTLSGGTLVEQVGQTFRTIATSVEQIAPVNDYWHGGQAGVAVLFNGGSLYTFGSWGWGDTYGGGSGQPLETGVKEIAPEADYWHGGQAGLAVLLNTGTLWSFGSWGWGDTYGGGSGKPLETGVSNIYSASDPFESNALTLWVQAQSNAALWTFDRHGWNYGF